MLHNHSVAVVVPAYNEETQITDVLASMPEFVDKIIVVNDFSKDKTSEVVKAFAPKVPGDFQTKVIEIDTSNKFNRADQVIAELEKEEIKKYLKHKTYEFSNSKVVLVDMLANGGVGAAIALGYKWAKDHNIDCTAVMAGDGQMDPAELESICAPVILEKVDYVKGDRLSHPSANLLIPKVRFLGNSILTILTKVASGYWHVTDTQTGYTAISLNALKKIRLYKIYKRYGMPNDMLVKLNIAKCTLKEIEIKPVYNVGEKSKMKVFKVMPKISWLLLRSFFRRIWIKYFIKGFHPLFILYNLGFLLLTASIPYIIKIIVIILSANETANPLTALALAFLLITGFQSILFAMWMDIQDNERLNK
jgi:glycosyltransferase involved in cell wall biosynthesis